MKKTRRVLWAIRDWLEPFKYERATYYTHMRVRVTRWCEWALGVCLMAVFGFGIAVLATGASTLELIFHPRVVTVQWILGLYVAEACRNLAPCTSPANIWGIIASVGVMAFLISGILLAFNASPIKPEKVTDAELDELRMLGYVVMEVKDFDNAIMEEIDHALNEHRAMGDRDSGGPGRGSQPGQLDTAGPVDRGAQPEAEGAGDLAEVDSRGA